MGSTRFPAVPHAARLVLAAALTAALSACYVVPIDPRTGQGYPLGRGDVPHATPGGVTVVTPPAPQSPVATTLAVRLYPLNPQANQGGMLTAIVVDTHAGRGTFSVGYLGDTLQGEATRVDAGYAAFGRVYAEVLGTSPRGFSGRRGIANAHGPKGVGVQCEYQITGPSMGTGACLFSDGAKYQMHFGG
jgi:hypothetical protein